MIELDHINWMGVGCQAGIGGKFEIWGYGVVTGGRQRMPAWVWQQASLSELVIEILPATAVVPRLPRIALPDLDEIPNPDDQKLDKSASERGANKNRGKLPLPLLHPFSLSGGWIVRIRG